MKITTNIHYHEYSYIYMYIAEIFLDYVHQMWTYSLYIFHYHLVLPAWMESITGIKNGLDPVTMCRCSFAYWRI